MAVSRGCIECQSTFESEEYLCPICGSERVICVEEAFFRTLDYYNKQLIKSAEDLELIREEYEW